MVKRVKLSDFYCPIRIRIHEQVGEAEVNNLEWADNLKLVPSGGTEYQALRSSKAAWRVAYSNHNASIEDLELMTDWMTWVFFHEDQWKSENVQKNPEELFQIHQRLLGILEGGETSKEDIPLLFAFFDLCKRTKERASSGWSERFFTHIRQHLQACNWKINCQKNDKRSHLSLSLKLQPYLQMTYAWLDLSLITHDIPLNCKFLDHIYVKEMRQAVITHMGWVTEILDYKMGEEEENSPYNFLKTLEREFEFSKTKALEYSLRLCNSEAKSFLSLESQLPDFLKEEQGHFIQYISSLRSWLRGHLECYVETSKYPF